MTNDAFHVGRCERMDRTDIPTSFVPDAALSGHGVVFLGQVVGHVSGRSRVHTAPILGHNDPDIAAKVFRRACLIRPLLVGMGRCVASFSQPVGTRRGSLGSGAEVALWLMGTMGEES